MLLDTQAEFSSAQAIVDDGISTNVIDLTLGQSGLTLTDIGTGTPVYLVIAVTTSVVRAAGACNVTFSLESDSTANLATSATVHWTSSAIGKATLVAGYRVCCIALPLGKTYERYLGVRYAYDNAADTAAYDAFLTLTPDNANLYADALSIA